MFTTPANHEPVLRRGRRNPALTLTVLLVLGCKPETIIVPTLPEAGQAVARVERESPRRYEDLKEHEQISVRFTLTEGAPENFRPGLSAKGVVWLSRQRVNRPMTAIVDRALIEKFKQIPWIQIHRAGPTVHLRTMANLQPSLLGWREAMAATRTSPTLLTEVVPWGNDSMGATYLRTTHGYKGNGGIAAVLDDGFHCANPDIEERLLTGWDYVASDNDACLSSGFSHGTSVAGIIAAEVNSAGVIGVAPEAYVRMFRVCHYNSNPAPIATCPEEYIEDALGYIYDNRGVFTTHVVNISLGLCGASVSTGIQANIEDLDDVFIPVIVSAGYCTGSSYWDNAGDIATLVTAHRPPGTYLSGFSTSGEIDLAAPDSVTADSGTTTRAWFGGTSAAVPYVAATVLLLREQGFPASTRIPRIYNTLKSAGSYLGDGLLDAKTAVKPRPSVSYWSWCNGSSGIATYGDCSFTLTTANGISPHQAMFIVSRSDVANDSTIYGWGALTRDIYIEPGDYELTVKAWVRDASPYLRVSHIQSIQQIPVCTEEAFLEPACGDS